MCPDHLEAGRQYIHTTVINIFYNNEQSIQNGKTRKAFKKEGNRYSNPNQ